MNNPNKGGRGKRAPYETVMCRTPKPIKAASKFDNLAPELVCYPRLRCKTR